MAKTITHSLLLLFLFFGTKSLHHRLRLRKRFVGWSWLTLSQLFKAPISCTKSTLYLVHKNSPVAKTIKHSLLFLFFFSFSCRTKSLQHRLRLRKRFVGWNWLLCGWSALSHPSLVQSPLSVQCIKTVQWPKQSTHSLLFLFLFFVGPSLCITD